MLNENIMKKPQLLTNLRDEHTIHVIDGEVPQLSRIHDYSSVGQFGWGFPVVEDGDRKRNVIDMKWLDEYNEDIDKLQVVIKRERSLSFSMESNDLFRTKDRSMSFSIQPQKFCGRKVRSKSFCVQSHVTNLLEQNFLQSDVSEQEESLSSAHSFEIDLPDRSLDDSFTKERVRSGSILQVSKAETIIKANDKESRPSTPFTEAFCSLQSCTSRDSGISASDDISDTQPEFQADCSLMEELEGACEFEQSVSSTGQASQNDLDESEKDDHLKDPLTTSDRLAKALLADSRHKRPVWYKRFSIGNIDVNLSSLNCGVLQNFEQETDRSSQEDSLEILSTTSDKEISNGDSLLDGVSNDDNRRRQRLRQLWTACYRLEALSLRKGSSDKGLTELTELVDTMSKLDSRLEMLKYDLHDLTQQVKENRKELNNLEVKATNMLESSATSRHHMTQLFCLEKLQERLQEEWWAVHYPKLVTLEENYIV